MRVNDLRKTFSIRISPSADCLIPDSSIHPTARCSNVHNLLIYIDKIASQRKTYGRKIYRKVPTSFLAFLCWRSHPRKICSVFFFHSLSLTNTIQSLWSIDKDMKIIIVYLVKKIYVGVLWNGI